MVPVLPIHSATKHTSTKILIVDDDAYLRDGLAEWLSMEGYTVLTAIDGADGLRMASTHAPDLVICDVVMPGMDGLNMLAAFGQQPALDAIPVILLSADVKIDNIRRAMQLGAADYLLKPFTCEDLLHAVRIRLHKGRSLDAACPG